MSRANAVTEEQRRNGSNFATRGARKGIDRCACGGIISHRAYSIYDCERCGTAYHEGEDGELVKLVY